MGGGSKGSSRRREGREIVQDGGWIQEREGFTLRAVMCRTSVYNSAAAAPGLMKGLEKD